MNKKTKSSTDMMLKLFRYRDIESVEHIQRTKLLMQQLIDALRKYDLLEIPYSQRQISYIQEAAALHDLGKAAIPDCVLLKPGSLTAQERKIMQQHTVLGAELAEQLFDSDPEALEYIQAVCMHHHERWDGSGYPDGLSKTDIPYPARLMAVVDVYDALTHRRPYKDAYPISVARHMLRKGIGTHFDPVIANVFLKYISEH